MGEAVWSNDLPYCHGSIGGRHHQTRVTGKPLGQEWSHYSKRAKNDRSEFNHVLPALFGMKRLKYLLLTDRSAPRPNLGTLSTRSTRVGEAPSIPKPSPESFRGSKRMLLPAG